MLYKVNPEQKYKFAASIYHKMCFYSKKLSAQVLNITFQCGDSTSSASRIVHSALSGGWDGT